MWLVVIDLFFCEPDFALSVDMVVNLGIKLRLIIPLMDIRPNASIGRDLSRES